jgi:hypothetical protein
VIRSRTRKLSMCEQGPSSRRKRTLLAPCCSHFVGRSGQQSVGEQIRNPFCVLHVGLAPRDFLAGSPLIREL